jgi:hypothetical protein
MASQVILALLLLCTPFTLIMAAAVWVNVRKTK